MQPKQTVHFSQKSPKQSLFSLVYRLNNNWYLKKQSNNVAYILGFFVNFIIFLSFQEIGIINKAQTMPSGPLQIFILAYLGLILFQLLISCFQQVKLYIPIQIKLLRFLGFPLLTRALLEKILNSADVLWFQLFLTMLFILVVMGLAVVFCSQSYSDKELYSNQIPINGSFIIVQVIYYAIQFVEQQNIKMLLVFSFMIVSLVTYRYCFTTPYNQTYEYKILSICSLIYVFYSSLLMLSKLTHVENISLIFYIVLPVFLYKIVSSLIQPKTISISFAKIFDPQTIHFEQFVIQAQQMIDQINDLTERVNGNFFDSLMFTFYTQHEKFCQKADCKFFSQNWRQEFKNINDTKTLKKLTSKVIRKLETLFEEVHKNQPQNITLKLSFIKFYLYVFPNKIRVMQLLSQLENLNLSWIQQYKIFKYKQEEFKINNLEVIDNLKIDQEVNQFQKISYITIRSMMEFWLQFSEEKVAFDKVLDTSRKVLQYKKLMGQQWLKNKQQEKFSTLKISLIYGHYLRHVIKDDRMADEMDFFSKTLEARLVHKKQIKYLSVGSESALIGASLTDGNLGKIVIANNQACNVFGYTKNQINKIRLNDIMPKIYAQQHDHYLMQFHKNRYKRINSDQRPLFAKEKNGYIIPIYLQLQRTISSLSEQLLFIANIRKQKVKECPLVCITDQEGQINDFSSGFRAMFYSKPRKDQNRNNAKNIQQIIPTFFQANEMEQENFKFLEIVKSQKYGDVMMEFTVTPVSFPLKQNGGFIIMGQRKKNMLDIPVTSLNLTKQIDMRLHKGNLMGNMVLYNPIKNRYEFDSFKSTFNNDNFKTSGDIYTIPFINIHDMTNILEMNHLQKDYGHGIKTLRLLGTMMVRAQETQTFESEQLSQTEKFNQFEFKLKQIKDKYLDENNDWNFIFWGRISILLIVFMICTILFFLTKDLGEETNLRNFLLKETKLQFEIRGFLSQFVLAFQGLASNYNSSYFLPKTFQVQQLLINTIQQSSIEQNKKEAIFKVVYLKQQQNLTQLIDSQTISFVEPKFNIINHILGLLVGYIVVLSVFFVVQIVLKCVYNYELKGIYEAFLGMDDKMIRQNYEACLKFSHILQEKHQEEKQPSKHEDFDQTDQNPIRRTKKYKHQTSISVLSFVKHFAPIILLILVCIGVHFMMKSDITLFNYEYQIRNKIENLFPQSSVALLNAYYQSYKGTNLGLKEHFNSTYQTLELDILNYERQQSLEVSFFRTLMDDACKNITNVLSSGYQSLCQNYHQQILSTGISKVVNYIASKITFLSKNSQNSPFDEDMFKVFELQYQFFIPIVKSLSLVLHEKLDQEVEEFQQKYKIIIYFVTIFVLSNAIYIYLFVLNDTKSELNQTKNLLHLISDNENEENHPRQKKKTKTINKIP